MAKKKQKEEEKLEEKKRAFLAKVAKQFLNDAAEDGFSVEDITELAVRLSYVMVRFSYLASMPKDMSEEKKNRHPKLQRCSIWHITEGAAKRLSVKWDYPTAKQRRKSIKQSLKIKRKW